MEKSISSSWMNFYNENIVKGFQNLSENPFTLFTTILDLVIVIFLLYCFVKMVKGSRAWQLIKGIAFLIIATWLSGLLNLKILNSILTGIMNWGVIAIIVIFQPELRRGLEQLGTNKFTKFFGLDSDLATKTKEDIYKVVIAATELSKTKTGRFNCNRKRNKNKRYYRNRGYFKCRSITTVIGKFVYSKYSFTRWSSYYK